MNAAGLKQFQVHKRLFLGLLAFSVMAAVLAAAAAWYLFFYPGRPLLYQLLLLVMIGLLAAALLFSACGLAGIVYALLVARTPAPLQGPMRVVVHLFFPLALLLGCVMHIDADRIKRSFVEVNNQLVRARRLKARPEELLLLAPHCLQRSECPHKITTDINNCRRCGRCDVTRLLDLREKYGIHIGMATGGTLARKYVREYRPLAIVAIACERDLTSGILDASPIPVLGVTNERPCGPCLNTRVDLGKVEAAIGEFLRGSD
ncbi:DUF116 domain-containing protein [Desulfotomaculum copahuensis]|nr:DUF116 domain-containing protein [Desulfotomaculum copahuensis]